MPKSHAMICKINWWDPFHIQGLRRQLLLYSCYVIRLSVAEVSVSRCTFVWEEVSSGLCGRPFFKLAWNCWLQWWLSRALQKWKIKDGKELLILKDMLCVQQFYNIFIINHRWLVVIDSNLKLTLRLLFCPNNNNQ